jgi:predicted dehydrogenase
MQPINVGIVSAGGAGRAHLLNFSSLPGVKVKTVFDPNERNLLQLPKRLYLRELRRRIPEPDLTTEYKQITEDDDIDVVSICSPDNTHCDYAIEAILAKKHVLVEKPLVTSIEQCKRLQSAILDSDYDKVFGVHHQMRYVPCFRSARELVQNQEVGVPITVEADYFHDMRERATEFDDWRMRKESVQSVALGMSSHTLDLMQWVLDSEVTEVFSYASHIGWPEYPDCDTMTTLVRFDSGAIGKATSSMASQRPQLDSLNVYGTKGSINNNLLLGKSGFKSFFSPKPLGIKKTLLKWILTRSPVGEGSIQNYPYSTYEHVKACLALTAEFVDCVRKNVQFPISFSEGAYAIQLCLASIQSYETGQPTKISRIF